MILAMRITMGSVTVQTDMDLIHVKHHMEN
jgi:hypothetical protein